MAEAGVKATEQLREITECPICMSAFTDPIMLPCIHTFCFECLNRTGEAEQKKPGDKMPCMLCRKEFIIPADGMKGVQKNFFMENLLVYKLTLQMGNTTTICDMCNIRNEGKVGQIPKATMRCLECQDYYCDSCVKVHQFQKVTKHHQMVNIGSDMKLEAKRIVSMKSCTKHIHKPLDYYCAECKKIVCVSCFVESHKFHDCKDVTTVDEGFRQTMEIMALKTSAYVDELMSVRSHNEKRKADFLGQIIENEEKIHKRNMELKDTIDRHTKYLLDELSLIKSKHLKEMEVGLEEIDRNCTILRSFETYCTELRLKGSASDICSAVDELLVRADELKEDHNAFVGRPHQSIGIYFQPTDLGDVLWNDNSNFVGKLGGTTPPYETFAVVAGLDNDTTKARDVVRINLHQPNEITTLDQSPTAVTFQTAAAVNCNTMYVTGIGFNDDEIWKYNMAFSWIKCASLVQGRCQHSVAFIDDELYICGGAAYSDKLVLDSVEAFNAVTNKCTRVGKLAQAVKSTGNCVPYRGSLYIFGGSDKDGNDVSHVQVYNAKENTCSLFSKTLPRPFNFMRAVLWETSVILIGSFTCFIYNFETETWKERNQFKADVHQFGLVLGSERVFVVGGADLGKDKDSKPIFVPRDDVHVRYVPLQNILDDNPIEWKIHGKLPNPSLIHACSNMRFK